MRTRYDQLAKQLFQAALAPAGAVEVEREVAAEVQKVDVWFEPDPVRTGARDALGLFGRMMEQPALFEAFHKAPRADEIRDCLRKHFALHHERRRTVRPRALPVLWVISASRPRRRIAEFGFEPMVDWPSGTYVAAAGLGLWLVVLPELPRTRETLLLRLLGAGRVLVEALADLAALDGGAIEVKLAWPIVVRLRLEIARKPVRTREEEELMADLEQTFEEFERRLLRKGRLEEVRRIVALRLRRPLQRKEARTVDERIERLGAERIERLALDSTAAELAAWLARPDAV